jgi:hypothetical protein
LKLRQSSLRTAEGSSRKGKKRALYMRPAESIETIKAVGATKKGLYNV